VRDEGVTHLVQPAGPELSAPGLEKVYEDRYYRVYWLKSAPGSG
jgi:hypothetical protein